RDVADIHGMRGVEAGDALDADDTLMHRLVREPGRPDHVANSVDAGLVGLEPLIDDDVAFLDAHFGLLEADILDIAGDADSKHDALRGHLRALVADGERRGDVAAVLLEILHRGAGVNLHALLLER